MLRNTGRATATVICLSITALVCTHAEQPRAGALYAVVFGENGYRVAKVLVVDEQAVHIRIYKETFSTRPKEVDASALTLGGIDDPDGFGVGHMPLAFGQFRGMKPSFIQADKVTEEDLDGYHYWQESNGGVWDPK